MHAPHDAITEVLDTLATLGTSTQLEWSKLAAVKANEVHCPCKLLSDRLSELGSQVSASDLVLTRLQEEVLDHRIGILWSHCALLMKARRYDDARRFSTEATALTHSRSASHVRRLELAKGLAAAPETRRPHIECTRHRGAIHA